VRRENFSSVGQTQSFSQTKTQTNEAEASKHISKDSTKTGRVRSIVSRLKPRNGLLRYSLHAALIAGVAICVVSGAVNSQASGLSQKSASDDTSLIAASALLSDNNGSVLGREVSSKAKDATGSGLATAGDEFLSKKTPVLASGAPSRDIMIYKVKDGDTLGSLSQKFSITTDTIKWANGIEDENSIKPGAELTILPVNGIIHTVVESDSLDGIAGRYQATASLIESFNGLSGKLPAAGTKLIVPDGVKVAAPAAVAARIATATGNGGSNAFTVPGFSGPGSFGNSYAYGYCTWYVASRRSVPGNWGNAYTWYGAAQRSGYGTGSAPRVGAVAWERSNHVAYVESVNGDGTVTVSEMNYWSNGGGWGRRSYRTTPASHFLYIY
jgi:surface antigen